jgi:hypothetical protein
VDFGQQPKITSGELVALGPGLAGVAVQVFVERRNLVPDPRALAPAVDLELAGNCSRRVPALRVLEVRRGDHAVLRADRYPRHRVEDRRPVCAGDDARSGRGRRVARSAYTTRPSALDLPHVAVAASGVERRDRVEEILGDRRGAVGQPALLYVRDDWESRYPVRTRLDRPLWQFRFLRRPDLDNVRVWQIHGFAQVEGISGRVDLDIMRPATNS